MCQRSCEAHSLGREGKGGVRCLQLLAREGSDAAPSRLSTWLEVLIQLSLLDHHYIDSAAQRAGTLTGWTDGNLSDWVTAWWKKPRCCAAVGTNKISFQASAGPRFFGGINSIWPWNLVEHLQHHFFCSNELICFLNLYDINLNLQKNISYKLYYPPAIHFLKCLQISKFSITSPQFYLS